MKEVMDNYCGGQGVNDFSFVPCTILLNASMNYEFYIYGVAFTYSPTDAIDEAIANALENAKDELFDRVKCPKSSFASYCPSLGAISPGTMGRAHDNSQYGGIERSSHVARAQLLP